MAKRNKIVKIKLSDKYFDNGHDSYFHSRENPVVLGYRDSEGHYRVQSNPNKRSYTWFVQSDEASMVQKPLILISVESED